MDDAKVEQLTDAEAEAVLLALGAQLRWSKRKNTEDLFDDTGKYTINVCDDARLVAQFYDGWKWLRLPSLLPDVDYKTGDFSSIDLAKAGCENHNAAGQQGVATGGRC